LTQTLKNERKSIFQMSHGFQYITKCLPTMCLKNNWNAILLKITTFKRRRKHRFKFRFFKEKKKKKKVNSKDLKRQLVQKGNSILVSNLNFGKKHILSFKLPLRLQPWSYIINNIFSVFCVFQCRCTSKKAICLR
jgi:hypothetical protein